MKYNNRAFPHPVLGINDDVDSTFQVGLKVSSDSEKICINTNFMLTDADLKKLIRDKKASFNSHVYCRGTMYREMFRAGKSLPEPIEIEATALHGAVEIDFFICAEENIIGYKNSKANPDYSEYSFNIEKGEILAYGGKGRFFANKSPEENKAISAFMQINTDNKSKKPMYNDYSGEKITVILSQEDYRNYQIIKDDRFWVNILHSSLVLPALSEAINFIKTPEAKEYRKYKWFELLEKLVKESKQDQGLTIAQDLLNLPINRTFTTLTEFFKSK